MSIRSRIAEWVMKAAPAVAYGSSDPMLAELFGAIRQTAAAISVTPETGLQCAPVLAAARALCEPLGTLPLRVIQRGPDGSRTEVDDHPVATLLKGDWNAFETSQDVRRLVTLDALLNDFGGLALVVRVDGRPREIVRLPPGTVSISWSPIGEPSYRLSQPAGFRELDVRDVIHVRALTSRFPSPRCPLTLAREAVALCLAMERHVGLLMGRGARPGGVIERTEATPARPGAEKASQDERRFNEVWSQFQRSGGTLILPQGAKFTSLEFKSVDLQFLELRKFQVEEIGRAFGVPPHMLYEMGRATWNNIESQNREWVDRHLNSWIKSWEAALSRALFEPDERTTLSVELDSDELVIPTLGDQAEAYAKLIAARVMNPNEIRSWMSLAPYSGGEQFANPNTMTAAPAPTKDSAA